MTDLADRIILITGAGEGIGRAASLHAASCGATVILLGRTVSKLEKVYDEMLAAGYPKPAIAPMDLETAGVENVNELLDVLDRYYGRLDGLLHNASILGEKLPIDQYSPAKWQSVIQINLNAVFLLTRILMPLLKRSDDGRLIFTSSSVGNIPRAYWGAYSVSKYAVEGFAKVLTDELETTSKIRVNIINPGPTRTGMRAEAYPTENPEDVKTAAELMPLYSYLLGPHSRMDHGRLFTTDWLVSHSNQHSRGTAARRS